MAHLHIVFRHSYMEQCMACGMFATEAPVTRAEDTPEEDHVVVPLTLKGTRAEGQTSVWLVFIASVVGEGFDCPHPACGAYTTKAAALAALHLPSTATPPDAGRKGDESPLSEAVFHGEGAFYCREFVVNGW